MDTLNTYRQIVQHVLAEYAEIPYAHGSLQSETIFDCQADRYVLMTIGWEDDRRVHGCLIHVDIINGKVWIQRDGTEQGITGDLVKAGVPQHHIVLGFHPADIRQYTEYAVS